MGPKFCVHCGKELKEGQEVCLGCGVLVQRNSEEKKEIKTSKVKNGAYKTTTGIIMTILSFCLLAAAGDYDIEESLFVFVLPGLCGVIAGILNLCSRKTHSLLITAGILFFVGAGFNVIGIFDISVFTILAVIFGILNIINAQK